MAVPPPPAMGEPPVAMERPVPAAAPAPEKKPARRSRGDERLDELLAGALDGASKKRSSRPAPSPAVRRRDRMRGMNALGTVGAGGGGSAYGSGYGRGSLGPLAAVPAEQGYNREAYEHIAEADFVRVSDQPLSTFAADVDTASYANLRRFLGSGRLPPADAVRIEELINYFDYDYEAPAADEPFSVHAEVSDCPWNDAHRLVHLGMQGREVKANHVPARNLVFLVDVSGSMNRRNKLPLLKRGLTMLTDTLRKRDRVAIVVYAGSSGLALESTPGNQKGRILEALQNLRAGGSTNGAGGIQQAYRVAQRHFVRGGINRVILATDGDFNVGQTSEGQLQRLIEQKRKTGVFLTVLGFGQGNLQDARMELLANKGNGNYAYIDSEREAHKVLVREAGSTLVTIAKDVKFQVEFNPGHVSSYRLIGYENRTLAARDFNDDSKDAGEVGAGHTVTVLYEVVPAGQDAPVAPAVDPLRYQTGRGQADAADSGELLTVKVRYKQPDSNRSRLQTYPLKDHHRALGDTSPAFRLSAAVAGFGMLLRRSKHAGNASLSGMRELAHQASARDPHGQRRELLLLMRRAEGLL